MGVDDNTIVVFTTDNGAENFTWPDGGQTPFAGGKGTVLEGGFRVPCIVRWPGKVPAGKVENGIMSGLDWFPTLRRRRRQPEHRRRAEEGQAARRHAPTRSTSTATTRLDLITGKGPSKRHEVFYFAEGDARRGAHRRLQVPLHRPAERLARRHGQARLADPRPTSASIRSSAPASATGLARATTTGSSTSSGGSSSCSRRSAKFAETFVEFPPMQKGASFNLEAVKEQIQKAIQSHAGK